ncbi:hypothetical protein [Tatumella punctata]|uniref:Uncharacterized protein n=1 Tax=Tatumella punctata TaxID=399969 RepID=A0ABW1VU63_9GAMM
MSLQLIVMMEDGRNVIHKTDELPEFWPVDIYYKDNSQQRVTHKQIFKKVLTISIEDKKYLLVSARNRILSFNEIEKAIKHSMLQPIN